MLVASAPTKIATPFASGEGSPYIRTVPVPSQIGITLGAASWTDGFPPWCFQAGGAPSGQDFNGVLLAISSWSRWHAAGGPVYYDATFQSNISGYPLGSMLRQGSSLLQFWISTVDGNMTNPDTGGAGWNAFPGVQAIPATTLYVSTTGSDTVPATGIWGTTTGTAFATPQACVNYASQFYSASVVTINIAAGTYTVYGSSNTPLVINKNLISSWSVVGPAGNTAILDASATPGGVGLVINSYAVVQVNNLTLKAPLVCLDVFGSCGAGNLTINMTNSAAAGIAATGAAITPVSGSTWTFTGTGSSCIIAQYGGNILIGYNDPHQTVYITIAYSSCTVSDNVVVYADGTINFDTTGTYVTFVGAPYTSSYRYLCQRGSNINVNGAGVNYIPSSNAATGLVDSTSIYG